MDLQIEEFLIGRKDGCHIRYHTDNTISSVHCKLSVMRTTAGADDDDDDVSPMAQNFLTMWVEDCSANGTYLNHERLTKGQKVQLQQNDEIGLLKPPGGAEVPPYSFIFQDFSAHLNEEDVATIFRPSTFSVNLLPVGGSPNKLPVGGSPNKLPVGGSPNKFNINQVFYLNNFKNTGLVDISEFVTSDGPSALIDVIAEVSSKPKMTWLDRAVLESALGALKEVINTEDGARSLLETQGAVDRLVGVLALTEVKVRTKALQILACMVVYSDKPLVESALRRSSCFWQTLLVNMLRGEVESQTMVLSAMKETCVETMVLINALIACSPDRSRLIEEMGSSGLDDALQTIEPLIFTNAELQLQVDAYVKAKQGMEEPDEVLPSADAVHHRPMQLTISSASATFHPPRNGTSTTLVTLRSNSDSEESLIAWRVMTNAPSRYRAKPSGGTLRAGETAILVLIFTPELGGDVSTDPATLTKDKFLVKSLSIPPVDTVEPAVLQAQWKAAAPESVQLQKVQCVHEIGAADLNAPLPGVPESPPQSLPATPPPLTVAQDAPPSAKSGFPVLAEAMPAKLTPPTDPEDVQLAAAIAASLDVSETTPITRVKRWGDGLEAPAAGSRNFVPQGFEVTLEVSEAIAQFGHSASHVTQIMDVGRAKASTSPTPLASTQAAALFAYTEETPLYGTLNYTMRTPHSSSTPTDTELKRYADYIVHTIGSLSNLPAHVSELQGKLYRGIKALLNPDIYAPGKRITWQAFSSSTKKQMSTLDFVNVLPGRKLSGSLFVIDSITAKDIRHFSAIPSEEEVLFPPNSQFKVEKVVSNGLEKRVLLNHLGAYDMTDLDVYVLKQIA